MAEGRRSGMSFKSAAVRVLQGAGSPMTAQEIVRAAIEQGLISTGGKTPEASMGARLYRDVARNPKTPFLKIETPGQQRAVRGSVRWTLKSDAGG